MSQQNEERKEGFWLDYNSHRENGKTVTEICLWFFDQVDNLELELDEDSAEEFSDRLLLRIWDTSLSLFQVIRGATKVMEDFANHEEIEFPELHMSDTIEMQWLLQCGNTSDMDEFLKKIAA